MVRRGRRMQRCPVKPGMTAGGAGMTMLGARVTAVRAPRGVFLIATNPVFANPLGNPSPLTALSAENQSMSADVP